MNRSWGLAVGCCLATGACGASGPAQSDASQVLVTAGNSQSGTAGYTLDDSLVVTVLDGNGEPISGVTVHWETEDGSALLSPATSATRSDGTARTAWRLGYVEGSQFATARVGTLTGAHFSAGAVSLPLLAAAGDTLHQCGFSSDGVLRCWLGATAGAQRSAPLATEDRFQALDYSAGEWCASATTGKLVCFNDSDLTRTGTFAPALVTPRLVTTFAPGFTAMAAALVGETVPTGPDISAALHDDAANVHCGLTAARELWCWGSNELGHLGDGSKGGSGEVPARVAGENHFVAFDVGPWNACAVDDAGAMWCWGQNRDLVLGRAADLAEQLTPTPVPTSFTFLDVAIARDNTVCGVAADREAVCWGAAVEGGLGRPGIAIADSVPTAVNSRLLLLAIRHTGRGFAGIDLDGKLVLWGGSPLAPANATLTFAAPDNRFTRFLQGAGRDLVCLRPNFGGSRCARVRELISPAGMPPFFFGVPVD